MQNPFSLPAVLLVGSFFSCCTVHAQDPPENLVGLVERRAVLSLTCGDKHPAVVRVESDIADRVSEGERPDMELATERYAQLMEERRSMRRILGPGHRRMLNNALRIRAVAGILQDFERMPFLLPLNSDSSIRGKPADEEVLIEDLENDMAAVALLQQLEGDWEIQQVIVRGERVRRAAVERIRLEDKRLQFEYAIEEISRVPSRLRNAFEQPWTAVGYHPRLEAVEYQKMIVSPDNDWEPVLCRRFVTLRDGQLVMVSSDHPQLPPDTLDPADDNFLFSCQPVSPARK